MAVYLEFDSFISLHRKTDFLAATFSSLTRASSRFFNKKHNKTHSRNIWALLTQKRGKNIKISNIKNTNHADA